MNNEWKRYSDLWLSPKRIKEELHDKDIYDSPIGRFYLKRKKNLARARTANQGLYRNTKNRDEMFLLRRLENIIDIIPKELYPEIVIELEAIYKLLEIDNAQIL